MDVNWSLCCDGVVMVIVIFYGDGSDGGDGDCSDGDVLG